MLTVPRVWCGTYNNILILKSIVLTSLFNLSDNLTSKAVVTQLS